MLANNGIVSALIYTRVSKDDQAREGMSLDAQLAECRRYAVQQGWVLDQEYQDILKGTRDDRPEYQALFNRRAASPDRGASACGCGGCPRSLRPQATRAGALP